MKGKRWVLTAALIVGGLRLWMQLRGKTKTPFSEWVIGWGVLFFFLALMSEWYPQAAGPLAGVVVTGDLLANGAGLFQDVTSAINTAGTAGTFVDNPFGAGAGAAATTTSKGSMPAGARGTVQAPPTVAQAPLHTQG